MQPADSQLGGGKKSRQITIVQPGFHLLLYDTYVQGPAHLPPSRLHLLQASLSRMLLFFPFFFLIFVNSICWVGLAIAKI